MNPTAEAGIDVGREGTLPATDRRLQLYVITVVILPILLLVSAIPIVRSDTFTTEADDPFLKYSDYPFSLRHADCDVVIFGDSTAVTGIDPTVVEKITGMKSCNIAESQSIVEILGPYALDTYLRNNVPPKYIVMQFSPEVLTRDKRIFWPEGLTLLFRKKSIVAALPTVVLHPVEYYNFAMWAIKAKVRSIYAAPVDFAGMDAIFQARHGLIILPKLPETRCMLHMPLALPSDPWVRHLRDTYSRGGTHVVIDVSPVPECTPDVRGLAEAFQKTTDNTLPIFPIDQFSDADRHLTLGGAEKSSAQIGAQILHLARR